MGYYSARERRIQNLGMGVDVFCRRTRYNLERAKGSRVARGELPTDEENG
jgi:hypothetical protein